MFTSNPPKKSDAQSGANGHPAPAAPEQVQHNDAHNAPMPSGAQQQAADHGVDVSKGHVNHGNGHH